MEHLESKTTKALVIVEGERLEPRFFNQYMKVFGMDFEIYVVGGNIYNLYNKIKEYNFSCDIKDVLPETGNVIEGMDEILKHKFAYTYLVFDFDAHHTEDSGKKLEIDDIMSGNISRLQEMVDYFTNETDPSVGRLYINYPMMESYKDCDDFFDDSYVYNDVCIGDVHQYKRIVGRRKLSSVNIRKYTKENFSNLTKMNVYKLNKILKNRWEGIPYKEYLILSEPSQILSYQKQRVETMKKISVLNTSLFIALDYYGNRNGFYDEVLQNNGKDIQCTEQENPACAYP